VDSRARAIEDVYRRRYVAFRNALATVTGSEESARDVVQDAFAQALRKRDSFRGDGPLEAWVWRIALRLAFASRQSLDGGALPESAEPALVDAQLDPELAVALRRLPPRRRLLLFLHYFGDLSYAEIAEVCGISEGTVAATLAQARNDLMTRLGQRGASA
jgi:RNA polymerase sigma-70 factor (ECF subfamily)